MCNASIWSSIGPCQTCEIFKTTANLMNHYGCSYTSVNRNNPSLQYFYMIRTNVTPSIEHFYQQNLNAHASVSTQTIVGALMCLPAKPWEARTWNYGVRAFKIRLKFSEEFLDELLRFSHMLHYCFLLQFRMKDGS